MFASLKLTNFKAFEEAKVYFKPLTILLGPNNSGKSSLLASLRLLAQTIESFDPTVPLLLNGTMGDFGTYKDIVYRNHRGRRLGIELTVSTDRGYLLPQGGHIALSLSYKYRTGRREVILKEVDLSHNGSSLINTLYSEDSERQLVQKLIGKPVPSALKSSVSEGLRMLNFLPQHYNVHNYRRTTRSSSQDFLEGEEDESLRFLSRASRLFFMHLRDLEYVGAMRVPPARTYLFTGEKRNRVGPSGENAANILVMDSSRGGRRSKNIITQVKSWLAQSRMAAGLDVNPISDRHYEIRVKDFSAGFQNFADVGFGHSQVLPVLVGGYNLDQGSIYLIEQPEIHLHPRAQAELGDFFRDLYKRSVQSIIETHSEHLVLRLQQHVVNGDIPKDDINFYYVYGSASGKTIKQLNIDHKGRFIDEWPEGFFPERLEEATKLARARFRTPD